MGPKFGNSNHIPGPRLVTRAELLSRGVPATTIRSWVRGGRLHPEFDGVYAVGYPLTMREERWLAAVIACGPGAVLSHQSAGVHLGFLVAEGKDIDVTAARSRKDQRGIRVHRPRTSPRSIEHRGIPTTTVAQTLLDLAATFTERNLEQALGEAQLSPFFVAQELEAVLCDSPKGVARLRKAWRVEHGQGVPRNLMERRFLKLMREAGVRRPAVNQPWGSWEIDALWLPEGIAVELDGRAPHTRAAQFQRDRDKDADLQLAGLIALRYTWADLTRRPAKVTGGCSRAFALRA